MIKMVALVKRKEDMKRNEFIRYLVNTHAPLEKKWPGLLKYVISSDIRFSNVNKKEYDGLAELWFKDENTLNMALESPERKISREDFQKFVKEVEIIVTKEHIILDKIKNL